MELSSLIATSKENLGEERRRVVRFGEVDGVQLTFH